MVFTPLLIALATPPNPLVGPSIEVDPGFAYYSDRSRESIAREIEVNGFRVVRYVVTNDADVDDGLIAAFHDRGIAVWYCTFTNGFYGSPATLPKGWEAWKTVLYKPTDYGYTFLSLSSGEYRKWKADTVASVMRKHAFDAIEFVEPFQVNWGGPDAGGYGDLSEPALAAFRKVTGRKRAPEFADAADPAFWKTDTSLYRAWVDFRAGEVTRFLTSICGSVRSAGIRKPICVWALANTPPKPDEDPVALAREWQGVDAGEIAAAAKPDLVCFQTNWPDWSNPNLQGDYVLAYKPFVDELRKKSKVPFIVQADLGSLPDMRRSRSWIADFGRACKRLGGVGWTAYSYEIADWLYTEAPEVKSTEITGSGVLLVFQKRLDKASAEDVAHYRLSPGLPIERAACDGNLVRLTVRGAKAGATTLRIDGVLDDVTRLGVKDGKPHACRQTVRL